MKKNILTIVGARPQFIKASTLSRLFKKHPQLKEILIHTGQHYDPLMSDVFFNDLQIPEPKYHLDIHGGSHGNMTGRMLQALDEIFMEEKPAGVLVYGDTNSTLAAALSAAKLHLPVIHIEAGLRSYNKKMPEETNRVLTDHLSNLLFCPTKIAVSNLKKEGITKNVHLVGDVMHDAALYAIKKVKNSETLCKKFSFLPNAFALMTVHRQESTQSLFCFQEILSYASRFVEKTGLKIVFPVHPRTKKIIEDICDDKLKDNFLLTDPLGYFEMQFLLTKAQYVLTDSGGLQKEAYFHQVPCITLRSETEWVETIDAGWNQLWTQPFKENFPKTVIKDYGVGQTAEAIVSTISDYLK